mgnify:CR=1 FL=1
MPSSVFTRTITGDQSPRDEPALPLGICITSTLTIFMICSLLNHTGLPHTRARVATIGSVGTKSLQLARALPAKTKEMTDNVINNQ